MYIPFSPPLFILLPTALCVQHRSISDASIQLMVGTSPIFSTQHWQPLTLPQPTGMVLLCTSRMYTHHIQYYCMVLGHSQCPRLLYNTYHTRFTINYCSHDISRTTLVSGQQHTSHLENALKHLIDYCLYRIHR